MLWEKELVEGELVYVDLMDVSERKKFITDYVKKESEMKFMTSVAKSTTWTQEDRKYGNDLFASGHFDEAISIYNCALRTAPNGSEDLGLAYANRSACFFKMKEYALCLGDIELAKANNYPVRLMPKLAHRETECSRLLAANGNGELEPTEPRLSFEADQKISCFVNGLEVKYSKKYGKHIVTNRTLDIGQTVIIEQAFIQNVAAAWACWNCCKRKANLIPSEKSITVMYCSKECRDADTLEDVLNSSTPTCGRECQILLIKSIWIAIKAFSTVTALMAAVDRFRAVKGTGIPYTDPAKRDYFQFFQLHVDLSKKSTSERNALKHYAMEVVEALARASVLRDSLRSAKIKRFLWHLALHSIHIIYFNMYKASHGNPGKNVLGICKNPRHVVLGYGLVLYSNQLNHSCTPNICRIFLNDHVAYKVLRPIKSGEQLFVSYLDPLSLMKPRNDRAVELAAQYNFVCDCLSCTSNNAQVSELTLDVLSCRMLALLDGMPGNDVTRLLPVSRDEIRSFERAAVNFLRKNDHLYPAIENLKMQFMLTQIWYLLMH